MDGGLIIMLLIWAVFLGFIIYITYRFWKDFLKGDKAEDDKKGLGIWRFLFFVLVVFAIIQLIVNLVYMSK